MVLVCAMTVLTSLGTAGDVVKTQGQNPAVVEGMDMVCGKDSVTVGAGKCRVGDKVVPIRFGSRRTALWYTNRPSVAGCAIRRTGTIFWMRFGEPCAACRQGR